MGSSVNIGKAAQSAGNKLGWPLVVLLILVLLVFASIRAFDTYAGHADNELFETRYLEHPIVAGIHILSGILFVLFAPFQFNTRLRTKHLSVHRWMGRVLVLCALVAGLYGLISAVVLPVFGGLASETASWFYGLLFLFSLFRAFWCIRGKQIALHREWMIRTFALALGVGTQRVLIFIFLMSSGYSFEQVFGPTLWLGFSINLLVAEIWINLSRTKKPF